MMTSCGAMVGAGWLAGAGEAEIAAAAVGAGPVGVLAQPVPDAASITTVMPVSRRSDMGLWWRMGMCFNIILFW